jgi:hypothetical protein
MRKSPLQPRVVSARAAGTLVIAKPAAIALITHIHVLEVMARALNSESAPGLR